MEHSCQCPFCEAHAVSNRKETRELKTKYGTGKYEAIVSVCSACGEDFVTPAQATVIDQRIAQLRRELKSSERTLSGAMIKEMREGLGLSQKEAAEIFGGGEVAFSRYEAESVTMGRTGELLLKLMYVWPETVKRIEKVRFCSLDKLRPLRENVEITNRIAEITANKATASQPRNKTLHIRWMSSSSSRANNPLLARESELINELKFDSDLFEIGLNTPEPNINHGRNHGYGSSRPQYSTSQKYFDQPGRAVYRP